MLITLEDLDGKYEVLSETSDGGPYLVNGDGMTEIRNARTYRKDKNGYIWESAFTIIGPNKVMMESTLDPSHASSDKFIKDEKGNLTKGLVTYQGELIARHENEHLVLRGDIRHGIVTTRIALKKI